MTDPFLWATLGLTFRKEGKRRWRK